MPATSTTAEADAIHYEFSSRPDTGDTMEVLPGLHWLRMPLPFTLGHINLWLLEDQDWTIVDTGVSVEESEQVWKKTLATALKKRPVNRIIVTHMHPDHSGCAGWLREETGAELWMTRDEYLLCRVLAADTGRQAPDAGNRFYTAAGFSSDQLHHYQKLFGFFGKYVYPMPESYHRIKDGDEITVGDHIWRVVVGKGHSPEHACLYCEEQNVVISGDQLLPTISSNVSVYPTEPMANPLHEWMSSLRRLKDELPEDVLVLPAHGKPFRGAHGRLDALIDEHEQGLRAVVALCQEPRRAVDVFPALFRREINDRNLIMATGEAIAHLSYLLNMGEISSTEDSEGVRWYQQN